MVTKPQAMYKKAASPLMGPLLKGILEAAKRGLAGGDTAAMKKGFMQFAKPGTDAFTMARGMYHSPAGAFGDMTVGAAAPTLKYLSRKFLGAKGKWVNFDPATGKSEFKFTGKYGKGDTFAERLGNSIYSVISDAEKKIGKHSDIADAAAEKLKANGHGVAGFFGNKMVRDVGIGMGAPAALSIGTALATGMDSVPSKAVNLATEAYFAPFSYLNPVGLGLTLAHKGAESIGGYVEKVRKDVARKMMATANEAAHATVDGIADEMANGGRSSFLYGAISPTSYLNKMRLEGHRAVDRKMMEKQMEYILRQHQAGQQA